MSLAWSGIRCFLAELAVFRSRRKAVVEQCRPPAAQCRRLLCNTSIPFLVVPPCRPALHYTYQEDQKASHKHTLWKILVPVGAIHWLLLPRQVPPLSGHHR